MPANGISIRIVCGPGCDMGVFLIIIQKGSTIAGKVLNGKALSRIGVGKLFLSTIIRNMNIFSVIKSIFANISIVI